MGEQCDCDSNTEYCSNGVSGLGCVKYDYGGLLKGKSWEFYAVIASALFVVFFSITWWQTNKQYKAQNNGKSIPWCPQKQEDDEEDAVDIQNGVDPNEPPAVSQHVVHSNGNGAIAYDDRPK